MSAEPAVTLGYPQTQVALAVRATYAAFLGAGFAFASWASRIPQVRDRLHLSSSDLGLVLLALAGGSLVALPLAGMIVHRINSRRTVAGMSVLLALGLAIAATGYLNGVVLLLVGLAVLGFANGAWDVAMNVQGASVERHLGRSIMPRFHAGFSAGTVVGALGGALAVATGVSVTVHLLFVAAIIALLIPYSAQRFLPDVDPAHPTDPAPDHDGGAASALRRWREPRTLLIGVVVLAFALAEGSGNDWINVALIDDYHAHAAVGTLGFATFLVAMTSVRWFGTGLLDRYGRVTVLRALASVSIAGLLLFIFSPFTPLAFAGAFFWGAGAALGFPVGMSAAADEPSAAAGRVSVVASVGYVAFLGGPPVIGFLGSQSTVLRALLIVGVLLAFAMLATNALREPAGKDSKSD